jgi:hypothetical protein
MKPLFAQQAYSYGHEGLSVRSLAFQGGLQVSLSRCVSVKVDGHGE